MLHVFACIRDQHDYKMLAMAAMVCGAGSWVGITTFIQARGAAEVGTRIAWILLSAIAIAAAEWATHFLAMLAYKPGLHGDWNLGLSAESMLVAFVTAAIGVAVASGRAWKLSPEIGGAIIGCGLATMHFIGMQAYEVNGLIRWDMTYVSWSIVIAVLFCSLAFSRASRPVNSLARYGGTACFVLGICGLHFTGMAAVTLIPDSNVAISATAVPNEAFALAVAAVAMLVIGSSIATYALERRITLASAIRMARLANATTDGMIIARAGVITEVNDGFLQLLGKPIERLVGIDPVTLWDDRVDDLSQSLAHAFDSEVVSANGERIPVQVIASTMAGNERIYTIRDLRARRASEDQMRYMAHHDLLTGLVNRGAFAAAGAEAILLRSVFAIIYVDLNRLKEINDTQGHATGDAVIVEIGNRMREVLSGSVCARLGGDEFAALVRLDGPGDDDKADVLAHALRVPFRYLGRTIRLSAAIGVSVWPRDGATCDEVLANADTAMYEAKRERGYGVKRFDPAMGRNAQRRRTLSHDLATAADDDTLTVHYQVQTDVITGATIGFEALLRWQHPTLGVISPVEFIPIAEENGTIGAIGAWVMERACKDAATWPKSLTVAVNLSPAQFQDDVVGMIASALAKSGLKPSQLEVEITESLLIDDSLRALAILTEIKALGVAIAMDDFGTGYSSLKTLQSFPFDKIKIDRSFVDKLETSSQARAIVRAVVGLGKSLGVPILAEGVETHAHLAFLREQGCSSAQGYLMGRPTPLEGTRRHVAEGVQAKVSALEVA